MKNTLQNIRDNLQGIDSLNLEQAQFKMRVIAGMIEQLLDESQCAGRCGATENLTECRAIPDSTYHLCPACMKDEEQP